MAEIPFPAKRSDSDPDPQPVDSLNEAMLANRFYVRQTQQWAIEQERMSHDQVLYSLGEYAVFALMWHIQDFEAGLVRRCSHCYQDNDKVERLISAAYDQPRQARCQSCYGTTFEGGLRALIFRPAIFTDVDEAERKTARGVTETAEVSIQATTDFRVHNGDFVFRSSGERYGLRTPRRAQVRSGFGAPSQEFASINHSLSRGVLEDPNSSVAFDIPPSADELRQLLELESPVPEKFYFNEIVNGPLIPQYMGGVR